MDTVRKLFVFPVLLLAAIFFVGCGVGDYRVFTVAGTSMNPTITEDIGTVTIRRTQAVERGDIVVYRQYNPWGENRNRRGRFDYQMKRVIAIGGDTVAFRLSEYYTDFILMPRDDVFLNGKLLDESDFLYYDGKQNNNASIAYSYKQAGFEFIEGKFALTIPQGYFFSMGDNRRHSRDGRDYGAIPLANLVGVWVRRHNA